MMRVSTFVAGSCAVAAISDIGSHRNPVDILQAFCSHELGIKDAYTTKYSALTNFYLFCAGPEVKSTEKGGSHHSKNHWPRYGTEFAAYLVENGLGEVASVGPKLNLKHHKETTAQAWLWSPNQKALEKWWNANQKEKPAPKAKAVPKIIVQEPPDVDDEDDNEDWDDPWNDDPFEE
jgi:hypothetical protein